MTEPPPRTARPVFLVAAPRSGTKLLRDTLRLHPEITTLPRRLTEVWSQGREHLDHDAYSPEGLSARTRRKIRADFADAFPADGPVYLEKNTCHALRMAFVRDVFPEAKFLHIYRNPWDSIASIRNRWRSPVDWSYLRHGSYRAWPLRRLWSPGLRTMGRWLRQWLTRDTRPDHWGPRIKELDAIRDSSDLLEVSIEQWVRCTEGIVSYREDEPEPRLFDLRYERLVRDPRPILEDVLDFLGLAAHPGVIRFAESTYTAEGMGRREEDLSETERRRVKTRVQALWRKLTPENGLEHA